jgi:ArsR family transcriptional regulator
MHKDFFICLFGQVENMTVKIGANELLGALKAAGEETRLRILALLAHGELSVGELATILEQSQPRISRHLRLLDEAGLIERLREGSHVYCRLGESGPGCELTARALALLDHDDPLLADDSKRARKLKRAKAQASKEWFEANAAKWDRIRSLHISEREVEEAICELLTGGHFDFMLDLGVGTGRMMELLAPRARRALGIDNSHKMLEYARSRLSGPEYEHCQLRHGDILALPYEDGCADLVIIHQVLHFLAEPQAAIREAGRLLRPGGTMLIVDFAPHELEFLREQFAHERLGFSHAQLKGWLTGAGLECRKYAQLQPPQRPYEESGPASSENGAGDSDDYGNAASAADSDMDNRKMLTVSLWLTRKVK